MEALTKRKMTLADGGEWHAVIPKDAIDWIESYTPKLAGTLEKDVLERVKREVQGSLAKGTSVRERVKALRDASPKVAAMTKARVEAIARTEVTRADTMGRLFSMKRDEDVIGVEFSAVLDSRTTPGCERRHGLMMRLDDPRLPYNTPPLNVNCRSMLLPVSTWDAPDGLFTSHEFDDVDMPRGGQRPEDVEVVRTVLEVMSNIEPAPPVSELRLNPDIVPPAGIGEHQAAKRAEQRSISSFKALPEARTIKEANEIAIKYGIAKRSDFSGLDISVANTVIADVARTKRMFPEMETFDFVGTMKRHDRMAWKLDVAEEIEKLRHRYPKMSGRELYKQAKKAVPYPEFEENTAGAYYGTSGIRGISFSPVLMSPQEIQHFRDVVLRYQGNLAPVGCDTIKSLVDHELGHAVCDMVGADKDWRLRRLYQELKKEGQLKDELSGYAEGGDLREFIAEGWREYQNNPSPRPVAIQVGERLVELARRKSGR